MSDLNEIKGITNDEFYSEYYFSEILPGDLKQTFAAMRGESTPNEENTKPATSSLKMLRDCIPLWKKLQSDDAEPEDFENFASHLLAACGYSTLLHGNVVREVKEGWVRVAREMCGTNKAPYLWFFFFPLAPNGEDLLTCDIALIQKRGKDNEEVTILRPLLDALDSQIFMAPEPPHYVFLLSPWDLVLLSRAKWSRKQSLRFSFADLFGNPKEMPLLFLLALTHRTSLFAEYGQNLLERLDESSSKQSETVSKDLKYAMREAIELLGNEVVHSMKEQSGEQETIQCLDPNALTLQCLRFMYRILFLLYLEAHPDLNYVPIKQETYRLSYSLDALSDLVNVPLTEEESRNGSYFHDTLKILFTMIWDGHRVMGCGETSDTEPLAHEFTIPSLRSHLFDATRTPLIEKAHLRNFVLQKIIKLLSLSGKSGKRRGRISYRDLNVSTLGSIYEGLLSYRGFFAKEDLYEVKSKDVKEVDELKTAYFVTFDDLAKYDKNEIVYEETNDDSYVPKKYPKGSFIYRMAGRDREKTASYYTPHPVAKCLVHYALKEVLKNKSANDILKITILEPAMGSAAFLNEAINQIAERYLEKKEEECHQKITDDEDYILQKECQKLEEQQQYKIIGGKAATSLEKNSIYKRALNDPNLREKILSQVDLQAFRNDELQRIRMYIADRNIFGVDVNPVAVELAEASLWLNSISSDRTIPWFGNQIYCGNSLIGASRQVWDESEFIQKEKRNINYYELVTTPPRRLLPGEKRKNSEIYHFLLPSKEMLDYSDKIIKKYFNDEIKYISEWRKKFCDPLSKEELEKVKELSRKVDELWIENTKEIAKLREKTTDSYSLWRKTEESIQRDTTVQEKDKILASELLSEGLKESSSYRRLKAAMDYWCALWFWPITKAKQLPSRDVFYEQLSFILQGTSFTSTQVLQSRRVDIVDIPLPGIEKPSTVQGVLPLANPPKGSVNIDKLLTAFSELKIVAEVTERHHFFHWELVFADIFKDRGGFDLILGNPPWIKVKFDEGGFLGDYDPEIIIHKMTAKKIDEHRQSILDTYSCKEDYAGEYVEMTGKKNFLSSFQNYPDILGMQVNLYKSFLLKAWMLNSVSHNSSQTSAITAFVHPEGIYTDPHGGSFRDSLYHRLLYHFQFENDLLLFKDIHSLNKFSINIYGEEKSKVDFINISNIFSVDTIYQSENALTMPLSKKCDGIRDSNGNLNVNGHQDRWIRIDTEKVKTIAKFFESTDSRFTETRLLAIHSLGIFKIIHKLSFNKYNILKDIDCEFISSVLFDETISQRVGTIQRVADIFPKRKNDLVLSGPHFYVGLPLSKTPRSKCTLSSDYDVIDLTAIDDEYLPRTNYLPSSDTDSFLGKIPLVPWNDTQNVRMTDFYRFANRKMIQNSNERTLISCIIPKHITHINGVLSSCFHHTRDLLLFAASGSSLPIDFLVKSTGADNAIPSLLQRLPLLRGSRYENEMIVRTLILNCLTTHYAELWEEAFEDSMRTVGWAKKDPRLPEDFFSTLPSTWHRQCALRTDYARRQALVELDVLVARSLGLTKDDLQTMYRIMFPVMQMYEKDTWYDASGRIVFTVSKGLPGVGLPRKKDINDTSYSIDSPEKKAKHIALGWEDVAGMKEGTITREIWDDTMPTGKVRRTITYTAPFDSCNREKDYDVVWDYFDALEGGTI